MLYPLTFSPVYKDYPWGGDGFHRIYGRRVPLAVCAESWEITDRRDGMSVVANGSLSGISLHELLARYGSALAGTAWRKGPFPLLIKLIDAKERLSLQVHPDVKSAAALGSEPKTEAWLMLHVTPRARVFAGLKPGVTKAEFRQGLTAQRVEKLLTVVPARAGEVVFIPGGRLHAIDAGCLLLEVQQNSNTTYRVYDWNRVGRDGRRRPLHLEEAFNVIDWCDRGPVRSRLKSAKRPGPIRELLACPFFLMERLALQNRMDVTMDGKTCHIIFVMEGALEIVAAAHAWKAARGTTWLIPAALNGYSLRAAGGSTAVRITLPSPAAR